jgi:hypothetical protein
MRPVSKKRQELMEKVKPIRDALREEVGHCEICGCSRGTLDVHEICRGVHRAAALDKPFALLLLCRKCHEEVGSAAEWPEARQLALLAKSRPSQFNLTAYLALTSPKAPWRIEIQEILAFMEEDYLTKQDVAERMQVDRRSVSNWITNGQLPAIDCRTVGASKPLYRVSWSDYLEFCKTRRVASGEA